VPRVGPEATVAELAGVMAGWELAAVVGAGGVLVGTVRAEAAGLPGDLIVAQQMQAAPPTVRPSVPIDDLARDLDEDGQDHVLVTTETGRLLGLVRRRDLDGS
jgi:CBS domain-containing protein